MNALSPTPQIAVRIPADTRNDIEAQLGDVGLSPALLAAGLRAIGRKDLVNEDLRDDSGRKRSLKPGVKWVVMPVRANAQQKRAIKSAAKAADISMSALLLNALLFELGLARSEPTSKGWQFGKRRTGPPKK